MNGAVQKVDVRVRNRKKIAVPSKHELYIRDTLARAKSLTQNLSFAYNLQSISFYRYLTSYDKHLHKFSEGKCLCNAMEKCLKVMLYSIFRFHITFALENIHVKPKKILQVILQA